MDTFVVIVCPFESLGHGLAYEVRMHHPYCRFSHHFLLHLILWLGGLCLVNTMVLDTSPQPEPSTSGTLAHMTQMLEERKPHAIDLPISHCEVCLPLWTSSHLVGSPVQYSMPLIIFQL
mmetsp:Transcript_6209/g.11585  ORF Transcript_6209/g.11585 Transcript_6209/m.11585 type:complete len:119 (-) Transcript_6209:184-540(-)